MVSIRRVIGKFDPDIFEYFFAFKKQVYTNYIVILPRKGRTKLNKDEISQSAELVWAGAEASIDMLLEGELDKKKAEIIKAFESSRKVVEA